MPIEKERVFDTKETLSELNDAMQKGLNKIVERFIDKFNTYEETHNYVMNIPCVKKLLREKETRFETADLTEEFKIAKIQELYKKVSDLTTENENLRKELDKYKSEEHISLKIIEKEKPNIIENDEKMYEQILNPSETTSKRVLMNNMFKVTPDPVPSDDEEEEDEDEDEEEDEDEDEESEDDDADDVCLEKNAETKNDPGCRTEQEEEEESEEEEEESEEEEEEESEEEEEEESEEEEEEEPKADAPTEPLTKTQEEDEQEEDVETENEEEEDVFEIEIDDVTYFTNNEENGSIYMVDKSGDPGKKIGHLKDGEPFFY
jgi:hypothetical protein